MMLTMLPSFVVFDCYELSCGWLMFNFALGTWNGATYYIEIFSKRYNLKFDKNDETAAAASSAAAPPSPSPSSTQDDESGEEAASPAAAAGGDAPIGAGSGAAEDGGPSPQSGTSTAGDSDDFNLDESQTLQLVQILQKLEGSKREGEEDQTLIGMSRN